ncbi:hypothetical protein CEXT_437091 [Caerostris extrusa]|uniref:Uncharacterized protein n=1 Tax=Caerostris extrusa TaxID=172846 RepID=A0AAV4V1K8_CAEEX|nr:hypothetical protein CEXT_437091 [Caerostris extrusa]
MAECFWCHVRDLIAPYIPRSFNITAHLPQAPHLSSSPASLLCKYGKSELFFIEFRSRADTMAMMNSFFCGFGSLRTGSFASGVYTLWFEVSTPILFLHDTHFTLKPLTLSSPTMT